MVEIVDINNRMPISIATMAANHGREPSDGRGPLHASLTWQLAIVVALP